MNDWKEAKWNRSLGTSKREQGIATPKAPHSRGHRKTKVVQAESGLARFIAGLTKKEA